ncbi:hypothetical protein E4U42_003998 [Claviceps africana]|uniref:Uncharacterized protein n=1 Tax=Claviceps africana TaxID=83212 RepID=A0A8K0NL52_9HYPO|nr:hypothetical protein E4U42_003998 [Claviceps africana]
MEVAEVLWRGILGDEKAPVMTLGRRPSNSTTTSSSRRCRSGGDDESAVDGLQSLCRDMVAPVQDRVDALEQTIRDRMDGVSAGADEDRCRTGRGGIANGTRSFAGFGIPPRRALNERPTQQRAVASSIPPVARTMVFSTSGPRGHADSSMDPP